MRYTIDLLKEGERRYEGPVSTRFLLVTGAGFGLSVIALVVAYCIFQGMVIRAQLERYRASWDQMEPRYIELTALRNTVQKAERIREEIEGWGRSGESWHRILLHIQREIPPSIQITRLAGRDPVEFPTRPQRGEPIPDPVRRTQILLSGRVVGAGGEEQVTLFIRALLDTADEKAPSFRTVSLVSMQRERRETDRMVNIFDIDITGHPRPLQ